MTKDKIASLDAGTSKFKTSAGHKNLKLIDTVRLNWVYCDAYRPSITLTSRDFAQGRLEGFIREQGSLPDPCRLHLPTNSTSRLRLFVYIIEVTTSDVYQFRISLPKHRILVSFWYKGQNIALLANSFFNGFVLFSLVNMGFDVDHMCQCRFCLWSIGEGIPGPCPRKPRLHKREHSL